MKTRQAIGYVVLIDGVEITLNLLDVHRGHVASHCHGVSVVTEVGSLLGIESGGRLLVMKVMSLSLAEPKEAHRFGIGSSTHLSEPLRNLSGVVVGQLSCMRGEVEFVGDSLSTPSLGSEVYPLSQRELSAVLGDERAMRVPVYLGDDLRGGGRLLVGLESLVSRHVAVLGSSGQGKSCFTAAVVQQLAKLPQSKIVIFDVNGEYEDALPPSEYGADAIKITRLGGDASDSYRIPYFALGRTGLQRLLLPSDKTQRPALSFALEHLNKVKWFTDTGGIGLVSDAQASMFDDCRAGGVVRAHQVIEQLRGAVPTPSATTWPPMKALGPLIADSHAITPGRNGMERNAFNYSNVAPLITRIARFIDDPMFCDVVDVEGGAPSGPLLTWRSEAAALVDRIFGSASDEWNVHIVDLRRVSHDLMPFVLGSLLELYSYELFRRGQEHKRETLLVLEEAHHYLRPTGAGDELAGSSLAYERLAKEGRKFGLALWLSTQRPSEISQTVLAQCNNWITFRLTSQKDLDAIQAASEWADRREVKRIAGLARQCAMAFGGSIRMATLIRAATACPLPRSEDGQFDEWGVDDHPAVDEFAGVF